MKKFLAIILSLMMVVGLCACASKGDINEQVTGEDSKVEKDTNGTYDDGSLFATIDRIGIVEKKDLKVNNYGVELDSSELSIKSLSSDFVLDFDLYDFDDMTLEEALSNTEYTTEYDLELSPSVETEHTGIPLSIKNNCDIANKWTIKEIVENNSWNLFAGYSSKIEEVLGVEGVFDGSKEDTLKFLESFGTPDKIYCTGAVDCLGDSYKPQKITPEDYVNLSEGIYNVYYMLVYDYEDCKFVVEFVETLRDGDVSSDDFSDLDCFTICNNKYYEEDYVLVGEKVEFWNIEDGFLLEN